MTMKLRWMPSSDSLRAFSREAAILVKEFQSYSHLVIVVLEDANEDVRSHVPRSTAKCNCFYLFDAKMCRRRSLPALRTKAVSLDHGQCDGCSYSILGPYPQFEEASARG
ncbi:hypothetical protein BDW71DRAFT_189794 [Aspergillus fruticulosus]